MQFPVLQNYDQAITLGKMMSERGFEMLTAERELLVRKLVETGECGDEQIDQALDLMDVACSEYICNAGPGMKKHAGMIFRLRPDKNRRIVDERV